MWFVVLLFSADSKRGDSFFFYSREGSVRIGNSQTRVIWRKRALGVPPGGGHRGELHWAPVSAAGSASHEVAARLPDNAVWKVRA